MKNKTQRGWAVPCLYYVERCYGKYRLFQIPQGSYEKRKLYAIVQKHLDDIKKHTTVSEWKSTVSGLLISEKPLLMDAKMNVVVLDVDDQTADGALIDEIYRIARWHDFAKLPLIEFLSKWRRGGGRSELFDLKEE